jgi:acetylornithine deacetylase/succinyl-diaminopimelate desuccinylase-like protein
VEIAVTSHTGWSSAHAVPPNHPLLLAAEAALEETSGTRPLRVRIGASLPITDIMARVLGLDVVMFSFATADEDFHAPNEFFRLSAIPEGLTAWISLLRRLGGHSQDDYSAFRGNHQITSI